MKSWTRLDWLIILIFAGLVLLFYWRILTPNLADRQSFPPGDFHAQFWAFTTLETRELSQGRLPLWNPYTFAGSPFWADVQAAVFYPPSLLTLLLSAPWGFSLLALELEAIAHFWLAAIFMYLFIRDVTHSRAAAIIAALTFTFSGYLTGYPSQQLAVLEVDIWLPLILFFLYRAHPRTPTAPHPRTPSSPHLILAGTTWGIALLGGHPQSALIVAYISSAYFVFLWLNAYPLKSIMANSASPKNLTAYMTPSITYTFRFMRYYALFIICGLALAAIQFLPAVEYTLLSVRAAGTYDKMSGGFPIIDLIQFLLPGQISFYSPLYIGIVGLTLALWVTVTQPNRHIIFWAGMAFLTLLITLGGNTFLYSPLYLAIPGFSIFRGQERWAFATTFSLAVMTGYAFNQILLTTYAKPTKSPRLTLQTLTKYLFLIALLFDFLFFFGLNQYGWTPDNPFYNLFTASTLLTLLLGLSWLLWMGSPYLTPKILTIITAGLICFNLFTINWKTNLYPQPPAWHTQIPAVVKAIKTDAALEPEQPFRVYNEFRIFDNYGIPYQLEDLWGASPLRPDRYDKFLAPPMPLERTWQLLNVKYVITWRQELFVPATLIYQEAAPDGTTYVHRLETVSPRAWLVNHVEYADEATILQTIADPNFDYLQTALLTNPLSPPLPNALATPLEALHPTFHSPQSLSVQTQADTPTLLMLSEVYYPGWQATIDGQSVPILRANYLLRAVLLPEGQHNVEFIFRPLSVIIGAIISTITLLALSTRFILLYVKK